MKVKREYLSTNKATDWPEESWRFKALKIILFFIPKANPGYDLKMHFVKKWLIEFEEKDGSLRPWREIALDKDGVSLYAGPDKTNYGFWLDTNLRYEDFEGTSVTKDEFEKTWKLTGIEVMKFDNEL